jgi:hypothetical protein
MQTGGLPPVLFLLDFVMQHSDLPRFATHFWSIYQPDTLGWVFHAGQLAGNFSCVFAAAYRTALQALVPELPLGQWAAMCVSESKGHHPRLLNTRLEDGLINGEKTYISMAELASELLVLCKTGEEDSRPVLKLVRVPTSGAGVHIERLPSFGFLQSIPHGRCVLTQVTAEDGQILPGDGYGYSKTFRLLEDIHVQMALLGHIYQSSLLHALPEPLSEAALMLAYALRGVYAQREQAQAHLALAGIEKQLHVLLQEYLANTALDVNYRTEMQLDSKVLGIARKAGEVRRQKAWEMLKALG